MKVAMQSCVGIVWGVGAADGSLMPITDRSTLAEAERYGDFLTHPRGHHEVWESWRQLGPVGLARRGLPILIAWHEYEYFPRGRVVFDTILDRFTLYADTRLWADCALSKVLDAFGLDSSRCEVRADAHYRTVRDI